MTMGMAIGYDWLYDALPDSSRVAIRSAIISKGLERRWIRRTTATAVTRPDRTSAGERRPPDGRLRSRRRVPGRLRILGLRHELQRHAAWRAGEIVRHGLRIERAPGLSEDRWLHGQHGRPHRRAGTMPTPERAPNFIRPCSSNPRTRTIHRIPGRRWSGSRYSCRPTRGAHSGLSLRRRAV